MAEEDKENPPRSLEEIFADAKIANMHARGRKGHTAPGHPGAMTDLDARIEVRKANLQMKSTTNPEKPFTGIKQNNPLANRGIK
ncbi:MAG: hypothetical protein CEO21_104 [Microgenomates group bacterium Gr01-1014_80]|nr:MAG: hypothetical protein CEO21_104 [Microgenomates group bacterium Gr01-1014_80]